MRIKDVMSWPPVVVDPEASLSLAASKMEEFEVGALAVVLEDFPVGILTDRDIVTRVLPTASLFPEVPVARAMSPNPLTCYLDQAVDEAAILMSDHQVRRVLILDRTERLVGLLSLGDIAENVSEELAGQALGEICESR